MKNLFKGIPLILLSSVALETNASINWVSNDSCELDQTLSSEFPDEVTKSSASKDGDDVGHGYNQGISRSKKGVLIREYTTSWGEGLKRNGSCRQAPKPTSTSYSSEKYSYSSSTTYSTPYCPDENYKRVTIHYYRGTENYVCKNKELINSGMPACKNSDGGDNKILTVSDSPWGNSGVPSSYRKSQVCGWKLKGRNGVKYNNICLGHIIRWSEPDMFTYDKEKEVGDTDRQGYSLGEGNRVKLDTSKRGKAIDYCFLTYNGECLMKEELTLSPYKIISDRWGRNFDYYNDTCKAFRSSLSSDTNFDNFWTCETNVVGKKIKGKPLLFEMADFKDLYGKIVYSKHCVLKDYKPYCLKYVDNETCNLNNTSAVSKFDGNGEIAISLLNNRLFAKQMVIDRTDNSYQLFFPGKYYTFKQKRDGLLDDTMKLLGSMMVGGVVGLIAANAMGLTAGAGVTKGLVAAAIYFNNNIDDKWRGCDVTGSVAAYKYVCKVINEDFYDQYFRKGLELSCDNLSGEDRSVCEIRKEYYKKQCLDNKFWEESGYCNDEELSGYAHYAYDLAVPAFDNLNQNNFSETIDTGGDEFFGNCVRITKRKQALCGFNTYFSKVIQREVRQQVRDGKISSSESSSASFFAKPDVPFVSDLNELAGFESQSDDKFGKWVKIPYKDGDDTQGYNVWMWSRPSLCFDTVSNKEVPVKGSLCPSSMTEHWLYICKNCSAPPVKNIMGSGIIVFESKDALMKPLGKGIFAGVKCKDGQCNVAVVKTEGLHRIDYSSAGREIWKLKVGENIKSVSKEAEINMFSDIRKFGDAGATWSFAKEGKKWIFGGCDLDERKCGYYTGEPFYNKVEATLKKDKDDRGKGEDRVYYPGHYGSLFGYRKGRGGCGYTLHPDCDAITIGEILNADLSSIKFADVFRQYLKTVSGEAETATESGKLHLNEGYDSVLSLKPLRNLIVSLMDNGESKTDTHILQSSNTLNLDYVLKSSNISELFLEEGSNYFFIKFLQILKEEGYLQQTATYIKHRSGIDITSLSSGGIGKLRLLNVDPGSHSFKENIDEDSLRYLSRFMKKRYPGGISDTEDDDDWRDDSIDYSSLVKSRWLNYMDDIIKKLKDFKENASEVGLNNLMLKNHLVFASGISDEALRKILPPIEFAGDSNKALDGEKILIEYAHKLKNSGLLDLIVPHDFYVNIYKARLSSDSRLEPLGKCIMTGDVSETNKTNSFISRIKKEFKDNFYHIIRIASNEDKDIMNAVSQVLDNGNFDSGGLSDSYYDFGSIGSTEGSGVCKDVNGKPVEKFKYLIPGGGVYVLISNFMNYIEPGFIQSIYPNEFGRVMDEMFAEISGNNKYYHSLNVFTIKEELRPYLSKWPVFLEQSGAVPGEIKLERISLKQISAR